MTSPDIRRSSRRSSRRSPRLLPRQWRKLLLTVHIVFSVGWIGLLAAVLILELMAVRSQDLGMRHDVGILAATLNRRAFPPAAVGTMLTGVTLGVGTPWGLLRHRWVVVKLALTVAVIITSVIAVRRWTDAALVTASAARADDVATSTQDAIPTLSLLTAAAVVHLLMLGLAAAVSVYKPWGRTRRGL